MKFEIVIAREVPSEDDYPRHAVCFRLVTDQPEAYIRTLSDGLTVGTDLIIRVTEGQ